MDRLTRHRFEEHEERLEHDLLRAVLNDGDGRLVVSRYRGLTGSGPCESVRTDVGRLWMPRNDTVMLPTLRTTGTWEPAERAFLQRWLVPGATVVNVGANVGSTALTLAAILGDSGQVLALEPDPLNFRLLCVNTRRAGTILPIHTAAGDATGSITLHRSATNAGDHRTAPHEDDIGGVEVPVVRIDDLVPDLAIDAIVSDTQGVDHRVVAGALATIRRCRPLLTVEFWPFGIHNAGDDPIAVLEGYRELDYASIVIVPTGEDVTRCSNEEIVERATADLGHTTLALLPRAR